MQLWRLNEFHLIPNGKEPIHDYEKAAEIGYFIEYGGENRVTKQHEKGLVKFQTPTTRIEVFSEQMPSYGYDSPLPSYNEPFESPYQTPEIYKEFDLCLTTELATTLSITPHGPTSPISASLSRGLTSSLTMKMPVIVRFPKASGFGLRLAAARFARRPAFPAVSSKALLPCVARTTSMPARNSTSRLRLGQGEPERALHRRGFRPGFGAAPMRSMLCKVTKVNQF